MTAHFLSELLSFLDGLPEPRWYQPTPRGLEGQISESLGLQVSIEARGKRGSVTIKFSDLDQLDTIIEKLQR